MKCGNVIFTAVSASTKSLSRTSFALPPPFHLRAAEKPSSISVLAAVHGKSFTLLPNSWLTRPNRLRDMANKYPSVDFTGVDLTPHDTRSVLIPIGAFFSAHGETLTRAGPLPSNVTVEIDDINLGLAVSFTPLSSTAF